MSKRMLIEVHIGKRYGISRLNCDGAGQVKDVIIDNESSSIPINFLIICASFYNFNYTKIILQEYVSVCYNGKMKKCLL